MAGLKFTERIQPQLNEAGDLELIDGREKAEQHVELKIQDHLYDILSEYDSDDVPLKIEKEIRTIVRNTDYIGSLKIISVQRVFGDGKSNSYQVTGQLTESQNIDFILDNL
jgi:hypothetical protein